ncbi:unnamed protein product [Mytilus edulis]|uniref:Uncharacterized protein n=1 Tax=Mytilus edulis TaxID=6550 RepID=A0A8S3VE06_MYTED|nr:unnamed protein product [Mytilus edulis]
MKKSAIVGAMFVLLLIYSCVNEVQGAEPKNSVRVLKCSKHCILPFTRRKARTLVDPSSGRILLRIANLTSFERTLYKSTCLAECHLCDNIFEIENTERTNLKVFKIKESKADEVPEHLVTLFENSISNLTEEQGIQMKGVLKRQADAFANPKNELGITDLIKHKINTGDATPITYNPRRLPLAKQEVADREGQRMLDIGVI